MLNLNLTSVFLAMKYQIPALKASTGGVIINTGTAKGLLRLCEAARLNIFPTVSAEVFTKEMPGLAAYTAAKAGLDALTKQVACEASAFGSVFNDSFVVRRL